MQLTWGLGRCLRACLATRLRSKAAGRKVRALRLVCAVPGSARAFRGRPSCGQFAVGGVLPVVALRAGRGGTSMAMLAAGWWLTLGREPREAP